jgi:hypothetical protein
MSSDPATSEAGARHSDFFGRFFKSIIYSIYVSKKFKKFGHCKNQNKSEQVCSLNRPAGLGTYEKS